ncbi:MAG: ABC transporter permease [Saprospiraceae bacterium]|nr:ABC transporter permease [Saprospiraceae bacterium]MBX7178643.1 ABC transporter permease [Saprospiraceae bacterium]MCB0590352.1 ABC transporter permease [Saprospiraceae bacterium]MCO5282981.1 ABC transporter permease [Saprospiraceae bacterium]MCO6471711.1 ABC transporter permease [Saprospiraceae bacterium]
MNFQRIKSTFRKERILLFRDMGGIAMLLVMPLLLILTMAIVQDAPFRDYQDIHLKMIWADEDGKPLGDSLKTMFRKSGRFDLLDSLQGRPITGDEARNLIGSGTYPIGVIVPKGSNAEMLNKTNKIINKIGKASGNPSIIPVRSDNDSAAVVLLFDPAAKATLKMAVQNSLEKMLFKVQLDLLFKKIGLDGDSTNQDVETESGQLLANQVRIESAYSGQSNGIAITSTQHNVPAWIVFALFFLIIPIAGSYIKEKGEGSRIRISMTPGSYIDIILGKVFFYTLFALFQFIFLFFVSGWVLPLAGLPAMPVGPYFWLALIASGVIAFAAISWGLMIGSYFTTYHQAMMFGSISVVLLSALGGIWIPIEVLPAWLQHLALLSPLQWSLSLFQEIFLRRNPGDDFFINMGYLITFGIICLLGASYFHRKER